MKIRFFQIIWILSTSWLCLIIYGGVYGSRGDELFMNIIIFGWPSIIGLIGTYVVTGSFLLPTERSAGIK